ATCHLKPDPVDCSYCLAIICNKMPNLHTDSELVKYMRRIAMLNRWDQVALRGCLMGIFSAFGTTIGFALVLIILVNVISGVRQIPAVDSWLAETKLDALIEKQIAELGIDNTVQVSNQTKDPLKYEDNNLGFQITYPYYLGNLITD